MSLLVPGITKQLLTQTRVIFLSLPVLLCMETLRMDTNCLGEGFCHIFAMPNPSVLNWNFRFKLTAQSF